METHLIPLRGNPGRAGIGGVIRDHFANIFMTFSGPLEDCDANEAEVSALLFGLQWYALNDLGPLIAEGDSSNTIAWAGNKACGPWCLAFKIDEIKDFVASIRPVLKHTRKSGNDIADGLAKDGVDRDSLLLSSNTVL
ncbi:uncharacterized protein LOC143850051 [Tasmannia lanceolata]|uniref:uncharacterized protein LOC143850051 n=1 Tax=Tasmannia lanceolata TaxID=3420 RepID=UPI004063D427